MSKLLLVALANGSSPLSRGIHLGVRTSPSPPGIIPALAGNTHLPRSQSHRHPDHPRSRGEYVRRRAWSRGVRGSSPLSRGIPRNTARGVGCAGIIPALAGNTITLKVRELWSPDHPRSRGEYTGAACQQHECRGSSPLSRGIRFPGDPGQGAFRIIPALAGNTHPTRVRRRPRRDHPRSRGEYTP